MNSKKRFYLLAALLLSTAFSNQVLAQEFTGDVAKIRDELTQTRNFSKALSEVQDLLQRQPNNAEAHMLCGKILNRLGYESLAEEEFNAADKLDPTQPKAVLAMFRKKLETEGPKAANEFMCYVQARFPYDPSVLIMQGLLARKNDQPLQAEFFYKIAMDRYPETPGLATALASLRISQKRYKEAIELTDRDLKMKKDHPVANLAKGEALLLQGSAEEAIPYLLFSYKNAGIEKKEAADLLSRAYISSGHYGEAIEPTLICIVLSPLTEKNAANPYKRRLNLILQHNVDPQEIVNTMLTVKRQMYEKDRIAFMYFAAGDVLDITGHDNEAAQAFAVGLQNNPNAGRAYMRLGKIKEKQHDYTTAMLLYINAYQRTPQDREIAARLARLDKRRKTQNTDLAWQLKDYFSGGRVSEVPKDTPLLLFSNYH